VEYFEECRAVFDFFSPKYEGCQRDRIDRTIDKTRPKNPIFRLTSLINHSSLPKTSLKIPKSAYTLNSPMNFIKN